MHIIVNSCRSVLNHSIYLLVLQVCDSDTVLDPACTIEMLKVLEEDPEVGGVGGDVQVRNLPILILAIQRVLKIQNNKHVFQLVSSS